MPQFPSDIQSLNYYMSFQFSQYQRNSIASGAQIVAGAGVSCILPMPEKINDHPSVDWMPKSFGEDIMSKAMGQTGVSALQAVGYLDGSIPNPLLVMLFKSPTFKKFSFSWTLAPKNSNESDSLDSIVKQFRKSMQPRKGSGAGGAGGNGVTLGYPDVVTVKFNPANKLFTFKPCVIESIDVDYTGAGMPAFFKSSQAPVQVKLKVNLTEIEYWTQDDLP